MGLRVLQLIMTTQKSLVMKKMILLCILFTCFALTLPASAAGPLPGTPEYESSLLKDFAHRSTLPQSETPRSEWYTARMLNSLWGPMPARYPGIEDTIESLPQGTDILAWKRDRVIALADPIAEEDMNAFYYRGMAGREPVCQERRVVGRDMDDRENGGREVAR